MPTEKITMPKLGESVTEGTISKWLVQAGDVVQKYDPIAEVTTDKVNSEIPSSFTGKIMELTANEGDTLEVGEVICVIEAEGAGNAQQEPTAPQDKTSVAVSTTPDVLTSSSLTNEADDEDAPMKKRYSPAVLRLSQEHGINLELVSGTGKGGRITRKDLLQIIDSGEIPQANQSAQSPSQAMSVQAQAPKGTEPSKMAVGEAVQTAQPGDIEIPVSGVRRAIATNMVRSKHEAPHAWMMLEVDVTELVSFRNSHKNSFKQQEGYNLTFLPFFIKAVVESLKEFPRMNATWAGDKIIEKRAINISVAVATDEALYVPVIKHADELTIKGLAKNIHDLASKVRHNQLDSAAMQGGTFTVNNTGSFGSIQSQPILNYPQAAILSVESIVKRPVVINGMIAIRDMVNLCLSLDHRVLDGLIAGRFLSSVKEKLEAISTENTSIY